MHDLAETARTVWARVREELRTGHVGWSFLTLFLTASLVVTTLFSSLGHPMMFFLLALPVGWMGLSRLQAPPREQEQLIDESPQHHRRPRKD